LDVLLGVDVGSSGSKAVAIHSSGRIIATGSKGYPTTYPKTGWAEQDPEVWYQSACSAIRSCLAEAGAGSKSVGAVAFVGPAHNIALLDRKNQVIRPSLHWSDLRSSSQAARLEQESGEKIFELSGQRVNPVWTLPQLLWIKESEPETWRRLARIQVTKDYVRFRFTGVYSTDPHDAVGTMLCELEGNRWSTDLCSLIGLDSKLLPPIRSNVTLIGTVGRDAGRNSGLPEGTPVGIGAGDSPAEAFGVGIVEPGQSIVKLGTAAIVSLVTPSPLPDLKTLTYPYILNNRGFTIAATNSGTATFRWYRERFFPGMSFNELAALAAQVPPGSEGLVFHPYLMGERTPYWDPALRGDFIGIGTHHTASHFARAIMEGVAFSLRECSETVESLGVSTTVRKLLGGGSRSILWGQILADVLGQPLVKPDFEDAAFGAALLAGISAGVFTDWSHAVQSCVRDARIIEPNESTRDLYDSYYAEYRGITHDLRKHSHRLAVLSSKGNEGGSAP
jgi:xylulokinase